MKCCSLSARRVVVVVAVVLMSLVHATATRADSISYSFDSPQFTPGETTPLLNRAPDNGPAGFVASFTSSSGINGFQLYEVFPEYRTVPVPNPNPSISGQQIIGGGYNDALTVLFNMPVRTVQLDFMTFGSGFSSFGDRLEFISPVGTASATSGADPTRYQTRLYFSSETPFNTFQLTGPTTFSIDNLTLNTAVVPAPEPSTWAMMGIGLLTLAAATRRKKQPARRLA